MGDLTWYVYGSLDANPPVDGPVQIHYQISREGFSKATEDLERKGLKRHECHRNPTEIMDASSVDISSLRRVDG